LGRKVESAQKLTAELEHKGDCTHTREDLRRRLHALGASARLLRFEAMERSISEMLGLLDRAGHDGEVTLEDTRAIKIALGDLSKLAWGEAARENTQTPPEVADAGPAYMALVVGGPRVADALRQRDPDGLRFECESTIDAQAAFDLAQTLCPDLVIVDADVPDTQELVEALMDDPITEQVPMVVIGSFSVSGASAGYVALGVAKTLSKPISQQTLRRTCEEAIFVREGRTMRLALNQPTMAELGQRLSDEVRHALVDVLDESSRGKHVPIGESAEVMGALWSAIARVREIVSNKTQGAISFGTSGPEGAIALAPSLDDDSDARGRARQRGNAPEVDLGGRTVLVADDDPAITWFLADVLKGAGCKVIEAFDGSEALRLAYQNAPELVIADILMPKLDGFGLCRTLKRDVVLRDAPVVLLSWKEDLLQRLREWNVGASGYLRKETDAKAILARLREALRTRSRIETRIAGAIEVRGRLDGISVTSLLRIVCRVKRNARMTVRDASFLYEIEVRDGAPVRAARTSGDGVFRSGPDVLSALLGVGAGRFLVAPGTSTVSPELVGGWEQQLARPVAQARAATKLVSGSSLFGLSRIELQQDILADYMRAVPERARRLLGRIEQGASPRDLVTEGACELSLLEELLVDLSARGAVIGATDLAQVDVFGPAFTSALGDVDARARGILGFTPSQPPSEVAPIPRISARGPRSESAPPSDCSIGSLLGSELPPKVAMAPSNDEPAIAVRSEEPEAPAQASEPAPSVRPAANYTPLLGSMHVADVAELSQAEHPTGKDHVVKEPTPSVSIPIVEASAPMTMASTSEFEHDTDEMVVARPEETPMVSVAKSDDEPIKVPEQRTWLAVLLTAVVLAVLGWAVFSGGRPGSASGSRTVQEPAAVPMVEAKVSTGVVTRELDVPVEVTVQPGQGVLEIVPPPGASLTVDGATRAAAPRVILPVAEGTHDVRVGEQSKQIQVRSSRLTQVVFDTP
jgi:CheY-like chemotaxis protein